jgi:hypothetical protein
VTVDPFFNDRHTITVFERAQTPPAGLDYAWVTMAARGEETSARRYDVSDRGDAA